MFLKRFPELFQFVLTRFYNNFPSKSFYILYHRTFLPFLFFVKIFFPLYPFIQYIAAHYVHENLGI